MHKDRKQRACFIKKQVAASLPTKSTLLTVTEPKINHKEKKPNVV
jgi:hypothetical protein